MQDFAALLDRLAFESGRNAKIRLLADHFARRPDPERGYALAALTGGLAFREAKAGLIRALIAGAGRSGAVRDVLQLCR